MTITNASENHQGTRRIGNIAKQISEFAQSSLKDTATNNNSSLKTLAVHDLTVKDTETDNLKIPSSGTFFNKSTEALTKERGVLIDTITGKRTKIYEENGEANVTRSLIEMNEEKIEILRKQLADI